MTTGMVGWLVVAAALFLIGYLLAARGYESVRRAGARYHRLRDNAEGCCREVQLYRRASAGLAVIAVVVGLVGVPFVGAGLWTAVMWAVASLYVWSRVAQVLTLIRPQPRVRSERAARRSSGGPLGSLSGD